MNIDLLVSQKSEAGLLCSGNLVTKVSGAILDTNGGALSLEFTDMDTMGLNIPIEEEFFALLDATPLLHIGSAKEGKIAQAYQIPLMILNDPYRSQMLQNVKTPNKPLAAFHYFVKNCVLGQPVHRDDMGNEDTIGCILGDVSPSALEFAQHLARRHGMELQNVPAPEILPGIGLGGNSSTTTRRSTGKQTGSGNTTNSDDDK